MKKKFIGTVIAISVVLILISQLWSWPLAGAGDEIDVYRVQHVVVQDGDGEAVTLSLTDAQLDAVAEILRTQRCRGLIGDPFPLSVASYEWEIDFMVGNDRGWHGHYGGRNFVYQSTSGPLNCYWRIANGEAIAAALEELLL